MPLTINGDVIVGNAIGKLREMKDGKGRCEWWEGTTLKEGWYPLDMLSAPLTDAEREEHRRREGDYNPFAARGGSFWAT